MGLAAAMWVVMGVGAPILSPDAVAGGSPCACRPFPFPSSHAQIYIGDPFVIRLVHGAVKENHVFHLHIYSWHAVPQVPVSESTRLLVCLALARP